MEQEGLDGFSEEEIEGIEKSNEIEIRLGEIQKLIYELKWSQEKLEASVIKKYGKNLIELSVKTLDVIIAGLKKKVGEMAAEEKKEEAHEGELVVGNPKEIEIEWDKLPAHVLLPKLKRARDYAVVREENNGVYIITNTQDVTKTHLTSLNHCDCKDWGNQGTSLNPCIHQLRLKYTDKEIWEELGKVRPPRDSPLQQSTIMAEQTQQSVFSGISQLQPRLCEIGKIKTGELSDKRTATGRRLPKKLDHFVITSILRDEEGNLLLDEEMNEKIGQDCKELDVYLCYDSPELNMPTFYAHFTQSKLRCMGDGNTAQRTMDGGGREELLCNPTTCEAYQQKLCKPYGRLSVILSSANRIGGAYIFRTTSWHGLRNILTSMAFIRTITGGILAGLPLKMRLIPMQVQPRDLGRKVTIYPVNIEFNGNMNQLMGAAEQEVKRRLQLGTNMRQIESVTREMIAENVREEVEEHASEISEEFAPEEVEDVEV